MFHSLFNVIGVALMTPFISRLVTFLERLFPEHIPAVSEPHFLNEAAMTLPNLALRAVVLEAGHLYDNAFDFIAVGLGLSGKKLRGTQRIKEVVAAAGPPVDTDIDDLYERRVKSLLGAIFEFATRAQPSMTPEQAQLLQSVRAATRDVSQAVKDVKHLNKNMRRYAVSDHAEIRAQYNTIRERIARILRETERLRNDLEITARKLKKLRTKIQADDILENGTLDTLVRDRLISQKKASSLINDNSYARNIGLRLIQAGRTIFRGKAYDLLLEVDAGIEGEADETVDDEVRHKESAQAGNGKHVSADFGGKVATKKPIPTGASIGTE